MTREQLLALGLSEEQVNSIMSLHGQATQGLNRQIETLNGTVEDLRTQTQQAGSEGQTEELENALKRISELEAENVRKDISAYAISKGLTGEKAQKILESFQGNLELAKNAIDSLSEIITEREAAAANAKEQELARNAGNPGGDDAGGDPEKAEDEANAENITFGRVGENAQSARDYYK